MTTLTTTFTLLRKANACTEGYRTLAKYLGSVTKYGASTPIDLLTILDSNGLLDTMWCLRATQQEADALTVARLFAIDCAERVLPIFEAKYPNDQRPRQAIQAAKDYMAGKISRWALRAAAAYAAAAYAAADAATAAYADAAYAAATDADAEREQQTTVLRRLLATVIADAEKAADGRQ